MRFAIAVRQYAPGGRFDAETLRAHLRRAEELGVFESAWTQEGLLSAADALAPLEILSCMNSSIKVTHAGEPVAPVNDHPARTGRRGSGMRWQPAFRSIYGSVRANGVPQPDRQAIL
jgi:hypothetical protein